MPEHKDSVPKDAREALSWAVDRANKIQALMQGADIPMNDITVIAATIVAATSGFTNGQTLNDAWGLYLAVYEHAELNEYERIEKMAEGMKNAVGDTIARVFQLARPKESTH